MGRGVPSQKTWCSSLHGTAQNCSASPLPSSDRHPRQKEEMMGSQEEGWCWILWIGLRWSKWSKRTSTGPISLQVPTLGNQASLFRQEALSNIVWLIVLMWSLRSIACLCFQGIWQSMHMKKTANLQIRQDHSRGSVVSRGTAPISAPFLWNPTWNSWNGKIFRWYMQCYNIPSSDHGV